MLKNLLRGVLMVSVTVTLLAAKPSEAGDLENLTKPDQISQQMYLRDIPMQEILKATVKRVLKRGYEGKLTKAGQCFKKFVKASSYNDVVTIVLASQPGVMAARARSNLHESSEGQKIMFYCADELQHIRPMVMAELETTFDRYLQLAMAKQG